MGTGMNAELMDQKVFEVDYNERLTSYLDRTSLDIHVVDDSAPVEQDERTPNDLIGVARVPLRGLLLDDRRIDGRFEVQNSKGEHSGFVVVEIVMTDTLQSSHIAKSKFGMAINEEWEADFIKALCQGIAKSSPLRDVDSVFNMFSKNQEMLSPELFR